MAMLLAPALRKAPREIAEQVGAALGELLASDLVRFEVAGPGFVNMFLSDDWHRRALRTVLDAGERFGAGGTAVSRRVLVEFVSANPTGPLVAAGGRHAAYGDALSRVLEHHGHDVWREYYFNDAGAQIRLLGESVIARARGEDVPEGGYQGGYVRDVAAEIPDVASLSVEEASARAVELLLAQIKGTLERYGVHYDQYFSERTLHEGSPSYLDRALEVVAQGGHSYESEGALWLRSTTFGDDKDRVLRRSDGAPTYLAADVAYLLQKRERGVELQLLPVGADHHGYVARMKAALGGPGRRPRDAGDADHPVRPSRGGRSAGGHVQAPRRLHHARRPAGRDRSRRHPLLDAPALPRPHARPRPGAGQAGVAGEPGLLRAVRPCADRVDAGQALGRSGGGGARCGLGLGRRRA